MSFFCVFCGQHSLESIDIDVGTQNLIYECSFCHSIYMIEIWKRNEKGELMPEV